MKKVIAIQAGHAPAKPFTGKNLADTRGRGMRDLRISVTDRCNFRCVYCMPREVFDSGYRFLPHEAILSFEEIARLARVFVGLGVQKIRLTGGEPIPEEMLATLNQAQRLLFSEKKDEKEEASTEEKPKQPDEPGRQDA